MQPKSPEVFSVSPEMLAAERNRRVTLSEALPLTARSIAASMMKLEVTTAHAVRTNNMIGALSSHSVVSGDYPDSGVNPGQKEASQIDLLQLGYKPDSASSLELNSDDPSQSLYPNLMAA